jgi:hypothetical protein
MERVIGIASPATHLVWIFLSTALNSYVALLSDERDGFFFGEKFMSGGSIPDSGFDNWRQPSGSKKPEGAGDGGVGGTDKCAIYETSILASPVASVIATLNVGEKLAIVLETTPCNRLVVIAALGIVAGAITSAQLVDMVECMQAGYNYQAEIKSITGGSVEVEISPAWMKYL